MVDHAKPTVLIGVSGVGGLFDEEMIRAMAARCDRPIIMPMSNPTSKAKAAPADLLAWTHGRAIVATGSPFDPVSIDGRSVVISQANNVCVFPGLGLGAIVADASTITDSMFAAAASVFGGDVAQPDNGVLPPIGEVATMSRRVAAAAARQACAEGVAPAASDAEIETRIDGYWWSPNYPDIIAS